MHSLFDGKANKLKEAESLKQQQAAHQKQTDTANAYARCFATEDGQKVMEHLTNEIMFGAEINSDSANVNYKAAHNNGQVRVLKMIIAQITRAQNL